MDYQDPFRGSSNPFFHQKESPPSEEEPSNKPKRKQPFSLKLIALCLVCALIGGLGGSIGLSLISGGSSSTNIISGNRTPVELGTTSSDTRKQMTVPEVYANNVHSCVGITVDIVSTNLFGQTVKGAAAGSGFVVTEDGYIITNYHVIQSANTITVSFVDGKSYPATLVGGDADNDIAVIKIDAKGLTPVILGDSKNMYVGESVVTIGNPLGELTFSLSDGVVSALDRSITMSDGKKMSMLQTNCTINSGNSGGPLFNLYGEVIGIVSAKYSSPSDPFSNTATVEGLGFAIPMNNIKDMITDLIKNGYVTGKPYLGISVQTVDSSVVQQYGIPAGAQVVYAPPTLCAAKAGIQEGDIITAVGDVAVTSNGDLVNAKNAYKAGDVVNFTLFRNGEKKVIPVKLDEQNRQNTETLESYVKKHQEEDAKAQPQQNQQQNQEQNSNNGNIYWPFS
ncbi:MAG: Serine protease, DegP/HtrA, do-like [Evtepia sp.]|jgi:serine protease Do|nr:Serine protease, DegP/HtrA, do-like [Evtepia sp.]